MASSDKLTLTLTSTYITFCRESWVHLQPCPPTNLLQLEYDHVCYKNTSVANQIATHTVK